MSGYLLQVASEGWLRAVALYSHLLTGVSFPLLYGGHILTQRRRNSRKRVLTQEAPEEGKVAA